jgi:hypothetical protein
VQLTIAIEDPGRKTASDSAAAVNQCTLPLGKGLIQDNREPIAVVRVHREDQVEKDTERILHLIVQGFQREMHPSQRCTTGRLPS